VKSEELIALEDAWGTHNYLPLDVIVDRAEGCWVYTSDGRRLLDCLSAYSALNQGHRHPRILAALLEQAGRVTLTSRAFRNEQLPQFCQELADLCGKQAVLPMNTGAEAVETAIKAARRWGYRRKAIPADCAEIIVCRNNFHGRTTTITGFSSDPAYRKDFGPFTPGFVEVPFGDADALERAITSRTCGFLFEPIQCEAGVLIPPDGYLRRVREICGGHSVLMIADEIQTGLGRTGALFACDHEGIRPDVYVLGKALSGGFYPVSAVVADHEVLGLFEPGSHGSTYGGNPLGCAVARAAIRVVVEDGLAGRSAELGTWLLGEVRKIRNPEIVDVRGKGLLIGIELAVPARPVCERLLAVGVLCKETHERTIRLAPPLITESDDLRWLLGQLKAIFEGVGPTTGAS
jgi:ornithine--oxo-acid transaminase